MLLFQLNAFIASFFSVKHRQRRQFLDLTLLAPLFYHLNAVNAAIFPVKRC